MVEAHSAVRADVEALRYFVLPEHAPPESGPFRKVPPFSNLKKQTR